MQNRCFINLLMFPSVMSSYKETLLWVGRAGIWSAECSVEKLILKKHGT